MIRRDYILRQLEQFAAMLAKITGLARNEQWQEASVITSGELQRLTGEDARALLRLSETELLAQLIESEPGFDVASKILMVVTLLKAEGDLLAAQGRLDGGREYYLKGLHLLLETSSQVETGGRPDFVPTLEVFRAALHDSPLPLATNALLMRHYEQTGDFAKAEDMLFEILDAEPSNPDVLDFGREFYRRLLGRSDDALDLGNLPRAEVLAGQAELDRRRPGPGAA
jgi:hypothetical protein